MSMKTSCIALAAAILAASTSAADAQDPRIRGKAVKEKWVTATESAAGTDAGAKKAAVNAALRKAVEQGCGVFLASRSRTRDYKLIYDKIIADAVGYVKEYKVGKVVTGDGKTTVTVTALVSTRRFRDNWASILHTIRQKENPRVIMIVSEGILFATTTTPTGSAEVVKGKLENFFLSKKIKLMDRQTGKTVSTRDKQLAVMKDDAAELAALGARFRADVIIVGKATAKYSKTVNVSGTQMHQFVVTLNVRAVETDSAAVLVSKTYGPQTHTTLQMGGGADKGLAKLAEESAPKLLEALLEAWRGHVQVSRTIQLNISGMNYKLFKTFDAKLSKIEGVQAVRMREITESVANIDVECEFDYQRLADLLLEFKGIKFEVTEITPNRIKLKVVK